MLSKVSFIGMLVALWAMTASVASAQPGYYDRGPNQGRDSVRCESRDYRFTRCDVNWRGADLIRQLSDSRCIEGRTWGFDRRGLWVDRGCSGVFVEAGRGGGNHGGWRPGPGWDTDIRLTCESRDYRYRFCTVDIGPAGRVRIEQQISQSACIEGRTWGANRAGIWVSGGCAAVFQVNRRWR